MKLFLSLVFVVVSFNSFANELLTSHEIDAEVSVNMSAQRKSKCYAYASCANGGSVNCTSYSSSYFGWGNTNWCTWYSQGWRTNQWGQLTQDGYVKCTGYSYSARRRKYIWTSVSASCR